MKKKIRYLLQIHAQTMLSFIYIMRSISIDKTTSPINTKLVSNALKVDLYDLVIFDHFWPSDWRGNRDEI